MNQKSYQTNKKKTTLKYGPFPLILSCSFFRKLQNFCESDDLGVHLMAKVKVIQKHSVRIDCH